MSALGQKQIFAAHHHYVGSGPIADMTMEWCNFDVSFTPENDVECVFAPVEAACSYLILDLQ